MGIKRRSTLRTRRRSARVWRATSSAPSPGLDAEGSLLCASSGSMAVGGQGLGVELGGGAGRLSLDQEQVEEEEERARCSLGGPARG